MSRSDPLVNPHSDCDKTEQAVGANPARLPFRSHFAPKCVVCTSVLSVSEQAVGKVCSRTECKNKFVREQAQSELSRKNAIHERMLAAEQLLVDSGAIPGDAHRARGVLPSNQRRLTGLPKRHIRVFVDRLIGIISQAAAIRFGNATLKDDGVDYDQPTKLSETQLAVLGNGCAVCRGHCCSQGSGHAFIHVDTILGYMERNPKLRPRDVLESYVSRIGHKTYEDSCVYHAETGCTLPRDMRSKVCNGYLCKGLHEILHQLDATSPPETFVISVSDYYPNESGNRSRPSTQAAVIDSEKVTPYPDVDSARDVEDHSANLPSHEDGHDDAFTSREA